MDGLWLSVHNKSYCSNWGTFNMFNIIETPRNYAPVVTAGSGMMSAIITGAVLGQRNTSSEQLTFKYGRQ